MWNEHWSLRAFSLLTSTLSCSLVNHLVWSSWAKTKIDPNADQLLVGSIINSMTKMHGIIASSSKSNKIMAGKQLSIEIHRIILHKFLMSNSTHRITRITLFMPSIKFYLIRSCVRYNCLKLHKCGAIERKHCHDKKACRKACQISDK